MREISLWGLAQCLLWASVSGLDVRTDCDPVFITTTVYSTIYAPNVTAIPTSTTRAPWENTTTLTSSSTRLTSSVPSNNTSTFTSSSVPWGNTTTVPTSSIGTTSSIPWSNTTTVTSSSIVPTTSVPWSNTTTVTSSSIGTTTSVPWVNTTTITTSSMGPTSSIPSSNSSTITSSSIVPTTSAPWSNTTTITSSSIGTTSSVPIGNTTTVPTSIPTSSTSAPSEPTHTLPPLPPPPFRGYKNAVYFTNWGVNSGFHPQKLPIDELTHILYAFADVDPDGTVKSSDPIVDLEKRYPGDSRQNYTKNAYGAVKQLFLHKKYNRNVKTLLSIGGWNFSPKFATAAATDASRSKFATSAVKLITDWGFDGIDIDWEYPTDDVEKANFVKLLAACRQELDRYARVNGLRYRFTISVASPASPANYEKLDLVAMNSYVDSWHLMAYDYSGSWDTVSGHQANVYEYKAATKKNLSTDDAVDHYESQGIHPHKILMGLPLYGRAFEGTAGLGQNYSSVGEGGPQPGVYYYKDLPKPGAEVEYDRVAKATYSYDAKTKEFISYDDVRSTDYKAEYLQRRRLGGAFFWEASGDKPGFQSLITTMSKNFGWLDETRNNLHYPTSQYRNIRRGLPGE